MAFNGCSKFDILLNLKKLSEKKQILQGGGYVGKSRSEAEAVACTQAACPHIHRFVRCGLWVTRVSELSTMSGDQLQDLLL